MVARHTMISGAKVRIARRVLDVRVTAGLSHPKVGDMGRLLRIENGNGQTRYIVESISRDELGIAAAWLAEFTVEELEAT